MMMRKQGELKNKLHQELQLRYKEYFESQLAIHLLKYPEYFPAVNKISVKIHGLLTAYKEEVIKVIQTIPMIMTEMCTPYFGACFSKKETVTPEIAYKKMLETLDSTSGDLSSIMQIHCIFVHRIYDKLVNHPQKQLYAQKLFPSSLFDRENRSRIEKKNVKATKQLGIAKHPVYAKMLEKSNKKHVRALDKFELEKNSHFYKTVRNIPSVCGPSGHTGSLLLGTQLYGDLNVEELSQYTLACFAFLTAGGNHSFHEVFIIANLLEVSYEINHYKDRISQKLVNHESFKEIQSHFPEFLI